MANGTKGYTPFQFGTGDPQGALQGTTWGQSNMTGGGSNWLMDMFKAQTPNVGAGAGAGGGGGSRPNTHPWASQGFDSNDWGNYYHQGPRQPWMNPGQNYTNSYVQDRTRNPPQWWEGRPGGTVWPGQQMAFDLAKGQQGMMGDFLSQLGGFFGGGGGIGGGFGGAWPPLVGSIAGTNAPPSAQTG